MQQARNNLLPISNQRVLGWDTTSSWIIVSPQRVEIETLEGLTIRSCVIPVMQETSSEVRC